MTNTKYQLRVPPRSDHTTTSNIQTLNTVLTELYGIGTACTSTPSFTAWRAYSWTSDCSTVNSAICNLAKGLSAVYVAMFDGTAVSTLGLSSYPILSAATCVYSAMVDLANATNALWSAAFGSTATTSITFATVDHVSGAGSLYSAIKTMADMNDYGLSSTSTTRYVKHMNYVVADYQLATFTLTGTSSIHALFNSAAIFPQFSIIRNVWIHCTSSVNALTGNIAVTFNRTPFCTYVISGAGGGPGFVSGTFNYTAATTPMIITSFSDVGIGLTSNYTAGAIRVFVEYIPGA